MTEKIYVNPQDDIQAVVRRIEHSEAESIQLVVPANAKIFEDMEGAATLRERAAEAGKTLHLVTNDALGRLFAERAGISLSSQGERAPYTANGMSDIVPTLAAARSVRKSPVKRISVPKKKPLATHAPAAVAAEKILSEKEEGSSFLKNYRKSKDESETFPEIERRERRKRTLGTLSTTKIIVAVLIVSFLVAGAVLAKVLPKSEVTLHPIRENASFSMDVSVDRGASGVDSKQGIIPGEIVTLTKSATREFSATGSANSDNKARGTITIYNEYSNEAQTFVPSRFQAEDGKIFWTTGGVTVPGTRVEGGRTIPGSVEAQVIAAEAGESYAIGPTRFSMPALRGTPREGKIYAVSTAAMRTPAAEGARTVTSDDIEQAQNALRADVEAEIRELKTNLPEGFALWEEAYSEELVSRTSSVQAGAQVENFTATVEMTARAVVFKKEDLENFINARIEEEIAEEKTVLAPSKEIIFLTPPVIDYQNGTIEASLEVKADIIDELDLLSFRGAVLGKSQDEIKNILARYPGIESVEVELWPFWVRHVPKNTERVTVTIFGT